MSAFKTGNHLYEKKTSRVLNDTLKEKAGPQPSLGRSEGGGGGL